MTQPEETTAALIARLHEELSQTRANLKSSDETKEFYHRSVKLAISERDAHFAATSKAQDERDEQRARAEKVEGERDSARLSVGTLNYTLAERTREREEARAESLRAGLVGREMAENLDAVSTECLKAQRLAKEAGAHCERVLKERDDAREQLAKLEWAGPIVAKWRTCPLCEGANPGDGFGKLIDSELGHRPTCWFAKQKAAPTVNTWRSHRLECPARTAEDVAWVDSRWQVNGCQAAPMEGPRPKPIGCEGCKCASPSEREPITHGTLLHPTHGKIKSHLVGRVSEMLKSGRLVFGCDFGFLPDVVAFNMYRYACGADVGKKDATKSDPGLPEPKPPALPGPKFKIGQVVRDELRSRSGVITGFYREGIYKPWKYEFGAGYVAFEVELTEDRPAAKEPARPEPRFKVGQRALWGERVYEVSRREWCNVGRGVWMYGAADSPGLMHEPDLKPAPKFAVGEWVTWLADSGEIQKREWGLTDRSEWVYELAINGQNWRLGESSMRAQTPQHKHDCKGCVCVFLGRYSNRRGGEWDLWYRDAPGRELGFDCGYGLQWWSVNARGGAMDQTIAEARRRAVARGLV